MRYWILLLSFVFSFDCASAQKSVKVLVITGGHSFDREAFFGMLSDFDGMEFTEAIQPKGNQLIEKGNVNTYDLLLFYDMYDSITATQKEAYIELLKKGTPMVFLHHSLVSYQFWPEFTYIIGGKFNQKDSTVAMSTYKHDEPIPVTITNPNHPITSGLTDFTILDETYGVCQLIDEIEPLLSTSHPESIKHLAWVNPYKKSQIVYIQSGHGPSAYADPNYQKLVYQAIEWSVTTHNK